jgi:protein-S-isoprenylcysteine O-methyltransferase Ste14
MQKNKIVFWATMGAFVVLALIVRFTGLIPADIRGFGFEHTPLARVQLIAVCVPWVIFSLYWEIAAKNAAESRQSEATSSRAVHLVLTNLALVLTIIQFNGQGRFLTVSFLTIGVGFAVAALGLLFAISARRALGRNWSGKITIKVEHQLIRSGPYRLLRHPIYTGILTMYAGTALVTGTWLAIVGVVMAVFAYARKIRLEEANMRTAFGPEYDAYCRESWALVPWLY